MPERHRNPYPLEFQEQMVARVWAGRTSAELAKEFEPSGQTLRNGVKQADFDAG